MTLRRNVRLVRGWISCMLLLIPAATVSSQEKDSHNHSRFTPEADILRKFKGFLVSFDSKDDDNGDGLPDLRRTPEWVSQEIRKWEPIGGLEAAKSAWCLDTGKRPSRWKSDRALLKAGTAPNNDSYVGSGFDRGHMAMKLLVERIGRKAARNTHTLLNAVPQRPMFNRGIWQKLELLTGAWAQSYGRIWVIQGPIFDDENPAGWIGDEGEYKIAIPDALFKVVLRVNENSKEISTLAFIYPQVGPGYNGNSADYRHERFLTTIREIEQATGLDFPISNNEEIENTIETTRASSLWRPAQVDLKNRKLFLNGCRN